MGNLGRLMSRQFGSSAVLVILGLFVLAVICISQDQSAAKKKTDSLAAYKDIVDRTISPEKIDKYLRFFTAEPHVASTPRNNDLAKFIFEEWKSYGLEDVRISEYDVLLSFPERISVEMILPKKYVMKLAEAPYPQDPDTQKDAGIPYNAYSRSGDITAPVIYANNGNPQDFDYLEKKGVKLQGKIALVRYSMPYSYRGFKALTAEKRGLAGLLIYSDPKDDGSARGPVFPDGPWGPLSHIQRGGIPFDFIYPGDPLTPGWASTPGSKRISPEEAQTIPKLISVPISAEDALPLFEGMGGEEAPEEWKGALPVTYCLGGETPLVHIAIKMDNSIKKISNVIGCIKGTDGTDDFILVGNHRDAWVFGGVDPSSGTATLMELARAFGEAKKAGFVPRRSIYFASWDAEEFTITGSTEWGEENREWLKKKLVAYLNVDSSASGQDFSIWAVPSLSRVILRSLQEVQDPVTGKTVYERWKEGPKENGTTDIAGESGRINPIGSGSDHTVFLNHICAPSLDMSFGGDYGVYHSMYDDYYWMTHFGDPGMKYSAALARIWAHQAIDLAASRLLPLDFEVYARELKGYLEEWARQFDPTKKRLQKLFGLVEEMRQNAAAINPPIFGGPDSGTEIAKDKIQEANRVLLQIERDFSYPEGIPNRTWFKHLIFGTRSTYDALLLPELQEAAEAGNDKGVSAAIAHLEEALARVNSKLKDIATVLGHRS